MSKVIIELKGLVREKDKGATIFMNLAKTEPTSIMMAPEERMDSILNWFEEHQRSFYLIGQSYVSNEQRIEELFYRSMKKVYKEWPRFKGVISFDAWVTSIFIDICIEFSPEGSSKEEGVLRALDGMNDEEKKAILLKFAKGMSTEEVAQILKSTVGEIEKLLSSGIETMRTETGIGNFHGCKEYKKEYLHYLERNIERAKKIDFEIHVYHCENCQEDLDTFQKVMFDLLKKMEDYAVPVGFFTKVKGRLLEEEKQRQLKIKKRIRNIGLLTGAFVVLIAAGILTGTFKDLYYTWTEDDEQLLPFLQHGYGERLDLDVEHEGIKVRIKSVIADDIQTLIFYEIEDTLEDNQYILNYHDGGFTLGNEHEVLKQDSYPRYYPPDLESDINNKEKNIYHGRLSLQPLKVDEGTIEFQISKLHKLVRETTEQNHFYAYHTMEYKYGEWDFEIPVTKQPSVEYELDKKIEVEGVPVHFEKLTTAPTAIVLNYRILNEQHDRFIDMLSFDHLKVNEQVAEADLYTNSMGYSSGSGWNSYQAEFGPIFSEKLKEVDVQLASAHLSITDNKNIELHSFVEYPHIFEYADSIITIDKVEVGQETEIILSNHDITNRAYESIQYHIVAEDENGVSSYEIQSDGILVDKNGTEYDLSKEPFRYEEIEQPRYFQTVNKIRLQNMDMEEKVIPERLELYGYYTTRYLDDVVTISVE